MELGINDPSGAAYAAGNVTALAYVALGNLLSVTDALGNVTSVSEYDSMSRVSKSTDALGLVTDNSFNKTGKLH